MRFDFFFVHVLHKEKGSNFICFFFSCWSSSILMGCFRFKCSCMVVAGPLNASFSAQDIHLTLYCALPLLLLSPLSTPTFVKYFQHIVFFLELELPQSIMAANLLNHEHKVHVHHKFVINCTCAAINGCLRTLVNCLSTCQRID